MDWLSKMNPDTLIGALSLFGTVAYWLYNKARGKKTETFEQTIGHAFDNFAAELLDTYLPTEDAIAFMKRARLYIEERAWRVLAKRGVPRNKLTEQFVHKGIERVVAYLGNKAALIRMPSQLDDIEARANKVLQKLSDNSK